MRNLARFSIFLIIVVVAFGCASTKTSTGTAATSSGAPVGTIHWDGQQFSAVIEGQWGNGTLAYNGEVYKFKTTGMGFGGFGGQKISATGDVYNLKNISDFPGKYSEIRSGATAIKGVAYALIRNDKGVEIRVKAQTKGLALTLGGTGMTVQMVE